MTIAVEEPVAPPRKIAAKSPTPIASSTPPAPHRAEVRPIPIAQLHESPINTRQHFDQAKLAELAESLRKSGQLTPLLVRPSSLKGKPGFEIAAGHRRRRAADLAGLTELLAIVRDMDDTTFTEVLTIENLQREDVHPLEEAQGYKHLLMIEGYDAKRIGERVGKSESYVYDRLKLLQLIPVAQELFFAHRITLGHAILIARLSAADQERLVNDTDDTSYRGGLWRDDSGGHATLGLPNPNDEDGPFAGLVPVSVRQLQAWIDTHVRFDTEDESVQQLFPETAKTLAAAAERQEKVISITREYHVHEDAKDENGERTYGPTSWKRADGHPGFDKYGSKSPTPSKPCDYSVVGVIAAGKGRGESFRVCVDKKRCMVHWGDEIRERNKRERARESASTKSSSSAAAKAEEDAAAADAQRKEAEERRTRWKKAKSSVIPAIGRAVRIAPAGSKSPIAVYVWSLLTDGLWGISSASPRAEKFVPRGTSAGDFLRHIVMCAIVNDLDDDFDGTKEAISLVKELKLDVDVVKIVDAVAPKAEAKAPAPKKAAPAKKSAAKTSAKRGK